MIHIHGIYKYTFKYKIIYRSRGISDMVYDVLGCTYHGNAHYIALFKHTSGAIVEHDGIKNNGKLQQTSLKGLPYRYKNKNAEAVLYKKIVNGWEYNYTNTATIHLWYDNWNWKDGNTIIMGNSSSNIQST